MSSLSVPEFRKSSPALAISLRRFAAPGLIAAGLVLRLSLSRAPLWNDEIWSILNLRTSTASAASSGACRTTTTITSIRSGSISSRPHPTDPHVLRFVSIVAGVFDNSRPGPARGAPRTGGRACRGGADRLLVLPVVYSVEARGYAVATLRWSSPGPKSRPSTARRLRLAFACGLGFFAHLAFGPALAGCLRDLRREHPPRRGQRAGCLFPKLSDCSGRRRSRACRRWGFSSRAVISQGRLHDRRLYPFSLAHGVGGSRGLGDDDVRARSTSFVQTVFALVGLPLLVLAASSGSRRRAQAVYLVDAGRAAGAGDAASNAQHPCRRAISSPPRRSSFCSPPTSLAHCGRAGWRSRAGAGVLTAALTSDAAAIARLARGEPRPGKALCRIAARRSARGDSDDFNVGKSVAYYRLAVCGWSAASGCARKKRPGTWPRRAATARRKLR